MNINLRSGLSNDLILTLSQLESGSISRQGYRLMLDRIGDKYDMETWEVREAMIEVKATRYDEMMAELYTLWSDAMDAYITHGGYDRYMTIISNWYAISKDDLYCYMQEVRESLQGPIR